MKKNTMQLSITVPDEIGVEVKRRTTNVSGFITEAVERHLREIRRQEALEHLADAFEKAQGRVDADVDEVNQRWRREGERLFDADGRKT